MKLLFTFFIIPLLLLNSSSQKEKFIGTWTGEDNGQIGSIIFYDEGYAAFDIDGEILGGKEFTMNGEKGKMTYTINFEATPIEIDFTMTKLKTGESKKLLSIAEFTDEDTIKFDISFDDKRPSTFGGNSIILKRVK